MLASSGIESAMAAAADAPADVLWMILKRLPIADHIRFGAVCMSWAKALAEKRHPPASQIPWVIIPSNKISPLYKFLSISDNKVYNIDLSGIDGHHFVASSEGWLVLLDKALELHIFHPISRDDISLPSVANLPGINLYLAGHLDPLTYFTKASVSISPSSFTVAVICKTSKLAFCRDGCESWTIIKTSSYLRFEDIFLHKDQLFALDWAGRVVICDVSDLCMKVVYNQHSFDLLRRFYSNAQKYIVESSGDIFQVWRHEESVYMIFVKVFKSNLSDNEWVEQNNIGDLAFLVGRYNQTVAISVQEFPELKRGCVYFLDNVARGIQGYNIEDGTIVSYIPRSSHPTC